VNDPITSVDPSYDWARRFLTLGIQEAVKLADEVGIEMTAIKAAAVDVAAFLHKWSKIPAPSPSAELKLVYPAATQLRLPFDQRPTRGKRR